MCWTRYVGFKNSAISCSSPESSVSLILYNIVSYIGQFQVAFFFTFAIFSIVLFETAL